MASYIFNTVNVTLWMTTTTQRLASPWATDVTENMTTDTEPLPRTSDGAVGVAENATTPTYVLGVFFIPWNNPDNLITRETQAIISTIFLYYCMPALFILGATGNVLMMAVFVRQGLKDRVNLMMFCIALSDLAYLLFATFPGFRYIARAIDPSMAVTFPSLNNPELLWLTSMLHMLSCLLLALMSIDRCLTVTLPMRIAVFNARRTLLCVLALTLLALLIHMPWFLMQKTSYMVDPVTNLTRAVPVETELAPQIRAVLPSVLLDVDVIIIKPIYVVLVLVCSIVTSVQIRQAARRRSVLTTPGGITITPASTRSETRINTMLMVICLIFLLCTLPDAVLKSFTYLLPSFTYFGRHHNAFLVTYHLTMLTKQINSSANFFVFTAMGSRFRRTLCEIVPCLNRVARALGAGQDDTAVPGQRGWGHTDLASQQSAVTESDTS